MQMRYDYKNNQRRGGSPSLRGSRPDATVTGHSQGPGRPSRGAPVGYLYHPGGSATSKRGGPWAVTSGGVGESSRGDCGHNTELPVRPGAWWSLREESTPAQAHLHHGPSSTRQETPARDPTHVPRPPFWRHTVHGTRGKGPQDSPLCG